MRVAVDIYSAVPQLFPAPRQADLLAAPAQSGDLNRIDDTRMAFL
jgi:hypothetical protein